MFPDSVNMFCKEQKHNKKEYLERFDNIKWGTDDDGTFETVKEDSIRGRKTIIVREKK